MDGHATSSGAPPPPPPPLPPPSPPEQTNLENEGKSPTAPSLNDSSSLRKSPRPPPPHSPQPPRPKLSRMGSSTRGNFHGRPPARDRLNSNASNQSHDMQDLRDQLRRRTSVNRGPQSHPWFEDGQDTTGNPAQVHTDRSLLIASLDHEVVEDEAEATLLEVLERRQVALDTQDRGFRAHGHRRNRSAYLPSIDLANLGSATRPVSAPSRSEFMQPLSRPSQASRSVSHGLTRSIQLGPRPPALTGRAVSSDWGFDSDGALLQTFSESADQLDGKLGEIGTNANNPMEETRPSLPKDPIFSNLGSTQQPVRLTTPLEKVRHVVRNMQSLKANNMADTTHSVGEGELPDLLQTIETHRDNDAQSVGSGQKSMGSGKISGSGGRASASRGSQGNASASRSADNSGFSGSGSRGHRTQRPFSGIASSPFATDTGFTSNMDNLFHIAEHVQELHQIPEEDEDALLTDSVLANMNTNFLSQIAESHPEVPPVDLEEEGATIDETGVVDEQTPMLNQSTGLTSTLSPRKQTKSHMWTVTRPDVNTRFYKILLWWVELRKQTMILVVALDLPFVKEKLWAFFQNEVSTYIVPALAISACFYYSLNNPILPIGSAHASISWCILFAIRHYITLQLANVTEYLVVDVLAMRSRLCTKLIGPLATLYTINAKGWPFILPMWGLFNLMLIQDNHGGNNMALSHWLYFTGIEMFTPENSSGGVVQSDTYKQICICMIIAGVATSLKTTLCSLYFGKRVYTHYIPKLEKILESMILLNEVADLGDAIDDFEFEKVERPTQADQSESKVLGSNNREMSVGSSRHSAQLRDKIRTSTMTDVIQKPKWRKSESDSDEEESVEEASKDKSTTNESAGWNRYRTDSHVEDMDDNMPVQEAPNKVGTIFGGTENADWPTDTEADLFAEELPTMDDTEPPIEVVHEPVQAHLRKRSTTAHIKSLLDTWEEPVNKQDKMAEPTIQDILSFRKALSLLEDTHPFGSSFGPAVTRESCIKSSKSLYKRLLSLSPGSPVLHFNIIGVLAENIDGSFDDKKAKNLVRLFRPDKFDEVSLIHFVQSCDGIYKKIRFLRASVGNSTLIDNVLESIIDTAFGFLLALTVMSILELNPWALLVSLSTVLVSFAFALGPSAAKLIEGMTMIAVRRPFDLGDRISIVNCTGAPDNTGDPGYHDTWIVEDINLFTTTLRMSRSNEVSTVNNGSIANTRIVNHGRSQNALVNISLPMRIDATPDQVQVVETVLKQHVQDNPRVWASLVSFTITTVDPAKGLIEYKARVQHVKSWQDLTPILQARGNLAKFCNEILMKLDIHYDGSATQNDVYIKELPDQQQFFREAALLPEETLPSDAPEFDCGQDE